MKDKDLKTQLEKARTANDIKRMALDCKERDMFSSLICFMSDKNSRVSSTAAWVMGHVVLKNKNILTDDDHQTFLGIVAGTESSSLKRNIMRAWQVVDFPETLRMEIAEVALTFLANPKEDIAVKAFSITVLQHVVKHIPELKEEVLFILEKDMPHATAAYISRAGQFMKAVSSGR